MNETRLLREVSFFYTDFRTGNLKHSEMTEGT